MHLINNPLFILLSFLWLAIASPVTPITHQCDGLLRSGGVGTLQNYAGSSISPFSLVDIKIERTTGHARPPGSKTIYHGPDMHVHNRACNAVKITCSLDNLVHPSASIFKAREHDRIIYPYDVPVGATLYITIEPQ
ncbi:hypothetical protein IWX49DRAFT_560845 [Phyllosticta citricarpa]|uniref:Uncharacterized protein n=1 Tax=Phyllosticta citricarpa TaxID=55181 RepID=A0ABR1MLT7_9PEZI